MGDCPWALGGAGTGGTAMRPGGPPAYHEPSLITSQSSLGSHHYRVIEAAGQAEHPQAVHQRTRHISPPLGATGARPGTPARRSVGGGAAPGVVRAAGGSAVHEP